MTIHEATSTNPEELSPDAQASAAAAEALVNIMRSRELQVPTGSEDAVQALKVAALQDRLRGSARETLLGARDEFDQDGFTAFEMTLAAALTAEREESRETTVMGLLGRILMHEASAKDSDIDRTEQERHAGLAVEVSDTLKQNTYEMPAMVLTTGYNGRIHEGASNDLLAECLNKAADGFGVEGDKVYDALVQSLPDKLFLEIGKDAVSIETAAHRPEQIWPVPAAEMN